MTTRADSWLAAVLAVDCPPPKDGGCGISGRACMLSPRGQGWGPMFCAARIRAAEQAAETDRGAEMRAIGRAVDAITLERDEAREALRAAVESLKRAGVSRLVTDVLGKPLAAESAVSQASVEVRDPGEGVSEWLKPDKWQRLFTCTVRVDRRCNQPAVVVAPRPSLAARCREHAPAAPAGPAATPGTPPGPPPLCTACPGPAMLGACTRPDCDAAKESRDVGRMMAAGDREGLAAYVNRKGPEKARAAAERVRAETPAETPGPRDYIVAVCSECLTASCWHGEFMCSNSGGADIQLMKASELRLLNKEHPDNYSPEKLLKVCGTVNWLDGHAPGTDGSEGGGR